MDNLKDIFGDFGDLGIDDEGFDFDPSGFELDFTGSKDQGTKTHVVNETPDFTKPRLKKPLKCYYEYARELVDELPLSQGINLYTIVSGNFIFGDMIEALILDNDLDVKHLYVSTLSLSENNIDSLVNIMASGRCGCLHLLVSSYFYSHERHNLVPYIYQELQGQPWDFCFSVAGSHMKMVMVETDDLKITIHGSANLRSSGNIEQFSLMEDPGLFEFNKGYFDKIEESYRINKKSGDRRAKLWRQVAE